MKEELLGTNGQLMAMAALRYCLPRHSYIVGACVEWVKDHWEKFVPNTKKVMLRDINEHLHEKHTWDHFPSDAEVWQNLFVWGMNTFSPEEKEWVEKQTIK